MRFDEETVACSRVILKCRTAGQGSATTWSFSALKQPAASHRSRSVPSRPLPFSGRRSARSPSPERRRAPAPRPARRQTPGRPARVPAFLRSPEAASPAFDVSAFSSGLVSPVGSPWPQPHQSAASSRPPEAAGWQSTCVAPQPQPPATAAATHRAEFERRAERWKREELVAAQLEVEGEFTSDLPLLVIRGSVSERLLVVTAATALASLQERVSGLWSNQQSFSGAEEPPAPVQQQSRRTPSAATAVEAPPPAVAAADLQDSAEEEESLLSQASGSSEDQAETGVRQRHKGSSTAARRSRSELFDRIGSVSRSSFVKTKKKGGATHSQLEFEARERSKSRPGKREVAAEERILQALLWLVDAMSKSPTKSTTKKVTKKTRGDGEGTGLS